MSARLPGAAVLPLSTSTPWLRVGPSVGALLELLEDNYRLLLCLAPDLRRLSGAHRAPGQGTDLHLDVIEQTPYTTLLRLTYRFPSLQGGAGQADPDARLRVCHDAQQVEVIALRQTVLPLLGEDRLATLRSKWNANWFLAKWLAYCVREDYRFFPNGREHRPAPATDSAAA
ncbi:DUF1249 domain-containing protein [Rhabdochromatium marinum]|uniref:DUF1249 domain-containing protein n=1 Tax=Rhabdochromatium marinum TaxID=48729 RepID=UPI0030845593